LANAERGIDGVFLPEGNQIRMNAENPRDLRGGLVAFDGFDRDFRP